MKKLFALVFVLALSLSLFACGSGSGAQSSSSSSTTASRNLGIPDADTSELKSLMDQAIIDLDKYEMDDAMLSYAQALNKYGGLINDADATQADIDAAVAKIKELRGVVVNRAPTGNSSAQSSKPSQTVSQANALAKAHDYLNFSAFSYSGLVEQLEFEGFSHDDAVYGADNCGADWNEQAAEKAADYLDYSAFSHSGLVEQLIFEGFTADQAEYGVTAVGL